MRTDPIIYQTERVGGEIDLPIICDPPSIEEVRKAIMYLMITNNETTVTGDCCSEAFKANIDT
jgi:hypothetical protein